MAFTALDVKKLREMTNVGMMDCKKALQGTLQPFLRTDNQNIKKGKCTKAQSI